ncbi:MAG: TIGR02757 family protein [Flavobacteriales bacterium]|nr:TIGR02757 family protein [Flavobacteriales bacterium]
MKIDELKAFLDQKADQYNTPRFIEDDPISIPHSYSKKEDVEISGFFSAILAWGQRTTIINNSKKLMSLMDKAPYQFIMQHQEHDLERIKGFVHRTFNDIDLRYFIASLKNIYKKHGGLENVLKPKKTEDRTGSAIHRFKEIFFELEHPQRTQKHIADPMKGSSAKRINMYLRWMVRDDKKGVDLGIWNNIPMSKLSIPLDVHTGSVSRSLGLLNRKQNDAKAVAELDKALRTFDPIDPVKYDFALFGLGAYENFGRE